MEIRPRGGRGINHQMTLPGSADDRTEGIEGKEDVDFDRTLIREFRRVREGRAWFAERADRPWSWCEVLNKRHTSAERRFCLGWRTQSLVRIEAQVGWNIGHNPHWERA